MRYSLSCPGTPLGQEIAMNMSFRLPPRPAPTDPFGSFYYRHTPGWPDRRPVLIALGGATAAGGLILLSVLALLA